MSPMEGLETYPGVEKFLHGELSLGGVRADEARSSGNGASATEERVELSEIVSALSYALDLTEDAVPGHSLRSCMLGMRIAAAMGMPRAEQSHLYYALLLKDAGCSSNSSRMCQIIGGDDRYVKTAAKLEDWTRPHSVSLEAAKVLWKTVLPGAGPVRRLGRLLTMAATQHRNNREMIALRCDRGASIARKVGLSEPSVEGIRHLDEHWDGSGYPEGRRGEEIPVLSRVMIVAQHLDIFASERDPVEALRVLRERSGRWFDPEIVTVAEALDAAGSLWTDCLRSRAAACSCAHANGERQAYGDERTRKLVLALNPDPERTLEGGEIDSICEAFADVVDAKSPFTFQHSLGVAEVACRIAEAMGLPEQRQRLVRRAALLHDIGKLRVPNSILDKQGPLTAAERRIVEEHPGLSREILQRISAFGELAYIAGAHHERLDGTGYPERRNATSLSLEARILGVADVYGALTEDRPYRGPLPVDEVLAMMEKDVPGRLDAECFAALKHCAYRSTERTEMNASVTRSGTRSGDPLVAI